MSDKLLVESDDGVATLTLNRPQARNALDLELITALQEVMTAVDADDDVRVVVLTGADPAFCAGLDLKQLGGSAENLTLGQDGGEPSSTPWPVISKPVIGAVNGVAVTGGLELALNCDILIASERARFADTHARVGVLPAWGLSVLLPQVVGRGLARRMSLTGDFLSADEALRAGLVTEVVAHDELLSVAQAIARTIAGNDQPAVHALLDSYRRIELTQLVAGYEIELAASQTWLARGFDPAMVEDRRRAVVERGRSQTGS